MMNRSLTWGRSFLGGLSAAEFLGEISFQSSEILLATNMAVGLYFEVCLTLVLRLISRFFSPSTTTGS
jgi:hypothetical protein